MAMNNSNYGYPTASGYSTTYSAPYSSTPTGMRAQRPRFAYSGPSPYPRPRSSASKPNPDSFSDSMINNYGNSVTRLDVSYGSENENTYNSSFRSSNSSSNYFSCNDSYYPTPEQPLLRGNPEPVGYLRDTTPQYAPKYLYNNDTSYGINDGGDFKGRIQKNNQEFQLPIAAASKPKPFTQRRFGKAKRTMTDKQGAWRCDLCSLDFTSQIPLEMHLRGAKHAKKLKARSALQAIQKQAKPNEVDAQGKVFHCELCNVTANSSLQLQTHLDGNKHKTKVQQQNQPKEENKAEDTSDPSKPKTEPQPQINGKSNGTTIRPLPSDFGEPQPAKLTKFSCDICNISVNSDIQLQQHLTSKRHQAKVEGKPLSKGKKNKQKQTENPDESDPSNFDTSGLESTEQVSNEASKTVKGVKTLTSSFVQGGTLQ